MGHNIDVGELQQVVGKYVTQYNLLVAGAPMAAAAIFKAVAGEGRLVNVAVTGSGVWFVVQQLSTPMLRVITDQFGYLQSVLGAFRS